MREVVNKKGLLPKEQVSKFIKVNSSNRNYQVYHNIIWRTTTLTGVLKCGRINKKSPSVRIMSIGKEEKSN